VSTRLIHPTGRKDDCGSVASVELLCHGDAGAGTFEIDIYECDIRPLAARQLQRFARRVRRPEYGKASLLEHRNGTVGDDCFIFDDQYHHLSFASS
jgi:hypothetical protein